jgi:IS5 family transposase
VAVAQEKKVAPGRRLRVDTTVVESNIHYPTDSGLLGDGARVLTRTMKKITGLTGKAGTKLRNRMRSIGHRVMEIARASRHKGPQAQEKMKQGYGKLLTATRRVVNQAKRFREKWPAA